MTSHPDNPHWCQEHDEPLMILSQADWDEASAAGHLTAEHVILRLQNIVVHALGQDLGSIAFDENGFVSALTSAGVRLESGVTLRVCTRDHKPPHVHIELSQYPDAKLRIRLEDGEYIEKNHRVPGGVSSKDLKRFQSLVYDHRELLSETWKDYHGDAVVFD